MINNKKNNDDYLVLFQGAKIAKREANIAGLSIIFGIVGVVVSILIPVEKTKFIDYLIIIIFTVVGFFFGYKVFKKKREKKRDHISTLDNSEKQ